MIEQSVREAPSPAWEAVQRLSAYRAAYCRWLRDGSNADKLSRLDAELLGLLETALATPAPATQQGGEDE